MQYFNKLINPPTITVTRIEGKKAKKRLLALFNDEELKKKLAKAVENENYEIAVIYRDELMMRNALL